MNQALIRTIVTADGPFTIVVDDQAVIASGWTDDQHRLMASIPEKSRPSQLLRSSLWSKLKQWFGSPSKATLSQKVLAQAMAAVEAYYNGDFDQILAVPVNQDSSFLGRVRQLMREIPAGQTASYGQLAARVGRPLAVRAVGSACSRNPAALFVPCHRVIRNDDSLAGFGYGLALKRRLLDREASQRQAFLL